MRSRFGSLNPLFWVMLSWSFMSLEVKAGASPGGFCDLWRDRAGITHAKASDEAGAFRCLGYLHGRDRAWQLDYLRRAYQGRLAEVLGTDSYVFDFRMRIMDLPAHARRTLEGASPAFRETLEAYAMGVNRGMKEAIASGSAYEFEDFGYRPEPWQPVDTVGVLLLQAFDQTRLPFGERIQNRLRMEKFGKDSPQLLSEDGLPWDVAVLKPGEYQKSARPSPRFLPDRDLAMQESETAALGKGLDAAWSPGQSEGVIGQGSNNWVVAPAHSRSGKALFANDPHLGLKTPAFWYWAHVQGGAIDAMGASLPGMPAIVSGLNRHMAWGLTNAYMDVGDVVAVPEIDLKDAESEFPVIWVRLWKFKIPVVFKAVRRTARGWPVLPLPAPQGKAYVLRWAGFDLRGTDLSGFAEILKAETVEEMDRILGRTRIPNFNFVFADTRGGTGYRTIGLSPDRSRGLPFTVLSSTLENYERHADWNYLRDEEMPHVLNPARGYVVTANNRQWPADAERFMGRNFRPGFRAARIEELLRTGMAAGKHDLESMKRIQCDTAMGDARALVPLLLSVMRSHKDLSPREKRAMKELLISDFEAKPSCTACAVYRLWLDHLKEKGLANERYLYRRLSKPFAEPEFALAVRKALGRALDDLKISADGPFPTWAEVHRTRFTHFAGKDYRRNELVSTPGDENAVNASIGKWDEKDRVLHQDFGASQRLVVELSNPPRAQLSFPGQVGDPRSPEVRADGGPWQRWARCRYDEVAYPLDWNAVKPGRVEF